MQGLIELFFISLPTVFSFMVLMRLEKEQSDAANKATYARSVSDWEGRAPSRSRGTRGRAGETNGCEIGKAPKERERSL